jgi:signal transduction histidine kinase
MIMPIIIDARPVRRTRSGPRLPGPETRRWKVGESPPAAVVRSGCRRQAGTDDNGPEYRKRGAMTANTDTHSTTFTRSLRLTADALGSLGLVLLLSVAVTLSVVGVGLPLLVAALRWQRRLAQGQRIRAAATLGAAVPSGYRPVPATGWFAQLRALLTDPATARDVLWAVVDSVAGFGLAVAPLGLWLSAAWQFVLPGVVWALIPATRREVNWLGIPGLDGRHAAGYVAAPLVGIGLAALAWWGTGPLVRTHARLVQRLLAAPQVAVLARRVDDLTRTRADSLDLHAAEIRRIERDLHDGAQARLVALGMSLGLAEKLLADRPEARSLLAEARHNNLRALAELRELVHGIHPPVLADRGLSGAVQALALDTPLPVEADVQLAGRPPAPAESAAAPSPSASPTRQRTPGRRPDPATCRSLCGSGTWTGVCASACTTAGRAAPTRPPVPACAGWQAGWPPSTGSWTCPARRAAPPRSAWSCRARCPSRRPGPAA